MSIANTQAETIINAGIIDDNDQVLTRVEHLKELENLVGNAYPNKYERSKISGAEDTISNLTTFAPIVEIVKQLKDATPDGEKPDQELKAALNEKLKSFGNARISGRLAVPPRVMGKAAFVHLSDGVNRLQIYVRRDDAKAVVNGAFLSETSATADGSSSATRTSDLNESISNVQSSAAADGSDLRGWDVFKLLDHGDFIGAEGFLFLTNTGELSVHVETLQFLAKSLMPMPDKMHEIGDAEISRRYRYVDLIASSLRNKTDDELAAEAATGVKKLTTREVFERRAKLISGMRRFLDDAGYIEVETPMLTPKATGAAATPFETHHNALDIPLYARIAPELYLKRLVVGGFEKVYELNRNFRNEGLSHKHNPEFTMLEFYCAYMDVNGMMDFAEAMFKESVQKATGGSLQIIVDDNQTHRVIDFSESFTKLSMTEAVARAINFRWKEITNEEINSNWLSELTNLRRLILFISLINERLESFADSMPEKARKIAIYFRRDEESEEPRKLVVSKIPDEYVLWLNTEDLNRRFVSDFEVESRKFHSNTRKVLSKIMNPEITSENQTAFITQFLFEELVEPFLIHPTFIIDYPKSISPLSKASPENPNIAERFELFINGMECANGFSELNDPQEQFERFVDQGKERESGDAEAMVLDEDYIRALAYGMPPAAGIGIGIDRLVMLLTDNHSIRDVILFPHMRPEKRESEAE